VFALLARAHRQIDEALDKRIEALQKRIDMSLQGQMRQLENDSKMATALDERLKHWIYEFKEHDNIFCVVFDGQRPRVPAHGRIAKNGRSFVSGKGRNPVISR